MQHDITPVVYYCNPNIYPEEEYLIRKHECQRYADRLGLQVIDDDYNHEAWLQDTASLADEPERGRRCLVCFRYRLLKAAQTAQRLHIEHFATTLASSRWKDLDQITQAGLWAASQVEGVRFMDRNWRKGGLQQRRNELLKQNGFYNQTYCGCEFSLRSSTKTKEQPPTTNSDTH